MLLGELLRSEEQKNNPLLKYFKLWLRSHLEEYGTGPDDLKYAMNQIFQILMFNDFWTIRKDLNLYLSSFFPEDLLEDSIITPILSQWKSTVQLITSTTDGHEQDAQEIEPMKGLFLGSRFPAQDREWLLANDIKYILTIAEDLAPLFSDSIHYKVIPIWDMDYVNISVHFEECFNFIDEILANKQKVLVHWYFFYRLFAILMECSDPSAVVLVCLAV